MNGVLTHHHGPFEHAHHHHGPHRHVRHPVRSRDGADHEHGHTHGRVDPSIVRSRDGVRAVAVSLVVLAVTAVLQAIVFMVTGSVALLADLIHNGGDALTAIPLAFAFWSRSEVAERVAGYVVVLAILVSAAVAASEAVARLLHQQHLDHLGVLALAGVIGFAGNELAARVRLRAGNRLHSAALVADGQHARVDGFVSLGVVASAGAVALGWHVADPVIGLAITALILRITWQAWQTIRAGDEHHH